MAILVVVAPIRLLHEKLKLLALARELESRQKSRKTLFLYGLTPINLATKSD
jgi:hypothetical protein